MTALAAPQILFSLGNPPPQSHTIYVSGKASDNDLTLLLSCTIDAEVTPATLVPPSGAGDETGSLFYLDLTPLDLDAAILKGLRVSAPGWAATVFSDGAGNDFLALTAAKGAPVKLAAGVDVGFAIGNFAMAATPPPVSSLTLLTYKLAGVATGGLPAESSSPIVFAQPPSGQANLADSLAFTFIPDDGVGVSMAGSPEIANTLTLTLSGVPGAATVQAGPQTVFKVQPVYATDANGFGALMTAGAGSNISIPPTNGWHTSNDDQTDGRAWLLTPPAGDLPIPEGNPVSFTFGPVVTDFQPGPTVLLLEYSRVPGFADGAFAVTVEKQAHVVIDSFSVDPPVSTLSGGKATVAASWVVANATRLTLSVDGDSRDVTGLGSLEVTITDTTEFQLLAEGLSPGSVDNRAVATATAEVKAVIERFSVWPAAVATADCNPTYQVILRWDVDTNDPVTLAGSVAGSLGSFGPSGKIQLEVTGPQAFTLSASDGVSATIELGALGLETRALASANQVAGGGFSPAAPLLAVTTYSSGDGAGAVEIYSTGSFQLLETLPVGLFPGNPAFSPDGATLLVPATGGNVSIFTIKAEGGGYSFTPLSSVEIEASDGSQPYSSTVGPDGTVYVSVGDSADGSIAVLVDSVGGYAYAGSVAVGANPYQCAMTPDATHLYAANLNGGSVSCLDLRQTPPTVSTPISGFTAYGPTGLAISLDGTALFLVNGGGTDLISRYDLENPSAPVQTMQLAGVQALATLPSGDYALAGCWNTPLALINFTRWTVSETAPSAGVVQQVTLSPDGALAMVHSMMSIDFTIITLIDPPPAGFTSNIHVGERP
jgi:hypothetical protein